MEGEPRDHQGRSCFLLLRTLVIGIGSTPMVDGAGLSLHLRFLDLIVSAKSLLPHNITFSGSRDQKAGIFGNHYLAYEVLGGSVVKNLPAVQKTQVRSLGWKDPLEEEMATHSGILAWESPWTEEPGRSQSMGSQTVGHNLATKLLPLFSLQQPRLVAHWGGHCTCHSTDEDPRAQRSDVTSLWSHSSGGRAGI